MYFVTKANIFASQLFWENISDKSQKRLCHILSYIYSTNLSKLLIKPFCKRYKITPERLTKFKPASGGRVYTSFQDFFTRRLSEPLHIESQFTFPCEGYVCESDLIKNLSEIDVKGQKINVREIFGNEKNSINDEDTFLNIFLHNHNYHRFHSPIDAIVEAVEHIPGKLLFLRPWFYERNKVSLPSFFNERMVIKLRDNNDKIWMLTFVAGMGVGTIKMHENICMNNRISTGEEIGLFYLGSTCCMSIPYKIEPLKYMSKTFVGKDMKIL